MTVKLTPFRYFPLPPFRQACRTRASRRTRHDPRIYINARAVPRVLSASHLDRVRQGEVRRHGRGCGGCAKWRSGHQCGRWIVANPMHCGLMHWGLTPWKLDALVARREERLCLGILHADGLPLSPAGRPQLGGRRRGVRQGTAHRRSGR